MIPVLMLFPFRNGQIGMERHCMLCCICFSMLPSFCGLQFTAPSSRPRPILYVKVTSVVRGWHSANSASAYIETLFFGWVRLRGGSLFLYPKIAREPSLNMSKLVFS